MNMKIIWLRVFPRLSKCSKSSAVFYYIHYTHYDFMIFMTMVWIYGHLCLMLWSCVCWTGVSKWRLWLIQSLCHKAFQKSLGRRDWEHAAFMLRTNRFHWPFPDLFWAFILIYSLLISTDLDISLIQNKKYKTTVNYFELVFALWYGTNDVIYVCQWSFFKESFIYSSCH